MRSLVGGVVTLFVLAMAGQSNVAAATSTTTTLLRVAFASPSDGVGLFETSHTPAIGSTGTCAFFVRETSDGGSRFGAPGASIATTNCATTPPVSGIAMDGVGDVFAYGPGLFVSHDSGVSWGASTVMGPIVALVPTGRSIWAIRASCGAASNGSSPTCNLTLLASSNAGRSWGAVPHQPPMRSVAQIVVRDADLTTWLVRDGVRTAYLAFPAAAKRDTASKIATTDGGTIETPTGGGTIEKTTDGGTSWTTSQAPCLYGAFTADLARTPGGALWLACAFEPGAGEQEKSLARSLDGGESWASMAPICEIGTKCDVGMPIGGYLGGLAALSADTAFFVGGRTSLTATRDAGHLWSTEPGFSGQASGSSDVIFVNASDGWAIDEGFGGNSILWRTVDGGAKWVRVATSASV